MSRGATPRRCAPHFGSVQVRRIVDRHGVYAGRTAKTPSVVLNTGVTAAHPAMIQ